MLIWSALDMDKSDAGQSQDESDANHSLDADGVGSGSHNNDQGDAPTPAKSNDDDTLNPVFDDEPKSYYDHSDSPLESDVDKTPHSEPGSSSKSDSDANLTPHNKPTKRKNQNSAGESLSETERNIIQMHKSYFNVQVFPDAVRTRASKKNH